MFQNDFVFADPDDRDKYDAVVKKFDEYFEPKKLVKGYITKFQRRNQGVTETIASYVTELRELAKLCQFGEKEDDMLAVQISNGVRDEALRRKLWDEDLTVKQVIVKCQSYELRNECSQLYSNDAATRVSADVHAAYGHYGHRGRSRGRGT